MKTLEYLLHVSSGTSATPSLILTISLIVNKLNPLVKLKSILFDLQISKIQPFRPSSLFSNISFCCESSFNITDFFCDIGLYQYLLINKIFHYEDYYLL